MCSDHCGVLLKLAVVGLVPAAASPLALSQVEVGAGQTLTQADLDAGSFDGVPFTLGPGTTFSINAGGAMDPVGTSFPGPTVPFDFEGSRIVLSGGVLASGVNDRPIARSVVAHAAIEVNNGGEIWESLLALESTLFVRVGGGIERGVEFSEGSVVTLAGGHIDRDFTLDAQSEMLVRGAGSSIGSNLTISGQSTLNVENGAIGDSLGIGSGSTLVFESGSIGANGALHSGSDALMTGGDLGAGFDVFEGSALVVHAGAIGDNLRVHAGGRADLFGGQTGAIRVFADAQLALTVHRAWLDHQELSLELNESELITARGGSTLSAVLSDGSQLTLSLSEVSDEAALFVTRSDSCGVADLAPPFGQLDASDVLRYVAWFGAESPRADIHPPFGSFDFQDVVAFLGAFGAGCP